jgi:hypothetical protein
MDVEINLFNYEVSMRDVYYRPCDGWELLLRQNLRVAPG